MSWLTCSRQLTEGNCKPRGLLISVLVLCMFLLELWFLIQQPEAVCGSWSGSPEQKRTVREQDLVAKNTLIHQEESLHSSSVFTRKQLGDLEKTSKSFQPPLPSLWMKGNDACHALTTRIWRPCNVVKTYVSAACFCIQHTHTEMTSILRYGGYLRDGLT